MSDKKDDSEERKLPPTEHKLREARKKGQISHCPDLVNASALTAAIVYLWLSWPTMIEKLEIMLILPAETYGQGFDAAMKTVIEGIYDIAVDILLPLLVIVIAVSLIVNMALIKGLLFSGEPIKPKAEKINPVNGFKKIFSLRNAIEMVKSIIKTALIFAMVFFLSWLTIGDVLKAPYCGLECVSVIFGDLLKPIIVVILLAFMLLAISDIGVQRWLFLRDMRMTRTEWKREHKDTEGDPLLKENRKLRGQELIDGAKAPLAGMRHATFVIADKTDVLIGLHFVQHITPSPIVVCKGFGDSAFEQLAEARQRRLTVHQDGPLARAIAQKMTIGEYIDEELFHPIAEAMILSGAMPLAGSTN